MMSLVNVASSVATKISSHLPISADMNSYFNTVEDKFTDAINSILPFVWIAAAIAIIGVGLMCTVGSERSKEMAKSKFIGVVIGCALVLGSLYIATGIRDMLQMSNFSN